MRFSISAQISSPDCPMSLLTGDPVRLLAESVADSATQHILFDRDEDDSFQIRLEAIRTDHMQLTREQIAPALPAGSRWADAVGWESYVVYSVPRLGSQSSGHSNADLAIVGLEYVLPHPTRTAYPVFAGAVLQARLVATVLRAIAVGLDADQRKTAPERVVFKSEARSPDEHRVWAAALLRGSAERYAAGRRPLVRTAVLSEDEVPPKLQIFVGDVRLGIVTTILPRLSWRLRALLL